MDQSPEDSRWEQSRAILRWIREGVEELFGSQVRTCLPLYLVPPMLSQKITIPYSRHQLTHTSSLAHAELYMTMAAVFRNFTFELYETDISDVELAHDFFLPSPKLDSKGVRVKVLAT